MSLDLYVKSKKPFVHSGTGVYVRENGRTFELKTIEDVLSRFPNVDKSTLKVESYESNEYFHTNLTHNLCEMAEHVPCGSWNAYQLLWHPEDIYGKPEVRKHDEKWNYEEVGYYLRKDYIDLLEEAMKYIIGHESELSAYNPSNGWGSYDIFKNAVCEMFQMLYKIQNYDDYYIIVSV